jgi:NHL repeat-containing protein
MTRKISFLFAALLAGCAGNAGGPLAFREALSAHSAQALVIAPARDRQRIFVSEVYNWGYGGFVGAVNIYRVGSNGDVAPITVISGSSTQLTQVEGIVVDRSGTIYVANHDTGTIVGFAPGASGNVAPSVVIGGMNTGLFAPQGLALDDSGNLYVTNCGACGGPQAGNYDVEEFSAGSNGNVAPVRRIGGPHTQFNQPWDIALDNRGRLFVVNSRGNSIEVFGQRAHGDEAPIRVISGSNTQLNAPQGVAVTDLGIYVGSYSSNPKIERFAKDAQGNAAPLAVISGSNTQLNWSLDGITAAPNGTIYAVTFPPIPNPPQGAKLVQFNGLASGNVAPLSVVTGPVSQLIIPVYVFVGDEP